MQAMNHVFLMGNLTRDPDKRTLKTGSAVADLGLAIADDYKDKEGKMVKRAVFVDVVTWGRQADNCAEFLKKGSPVLVEGQLQLDQWSTDQGEKRQKLRVRASRVQFLGAPAGADPKSNPRRVRSQTQEVSDDEDSF